MEKTSKAYLGKYQIVEEYIDKLEEVFKEHNTEIISRVHDGNTTEIECRFYSPVGQEYLFRLEVSNHTNNTIDDFYAEIANSLWQFHENTDVSYNTYIWLDNFGHGKAGAPYDMKDCYEDMEWCDNKVKDLYSIVYDL